MSSTAAAPARQLNGHTVVLPDAAREAASEAAFLDKLLQIRDEVLADKHPRIRLPRSVLEQVAPRPTQPQPPTPPLPNRPTTNGTSNGGQQMHLLPPRPGSSQQQSQAPNSSPAHASRSFPAASASSGIDPVLLTKSDHLIRAELQLKRQQIERAVKDQNDRKYRSKDVTAEDQWAHLDVDSVLAKAQALVKPVSGLRPTAPNSDGGTSFDENSYYSSQANSWSSEENDANQPAQSANTADPLTSQANASANASATEGELTAGNGSRQSASTHIQPTVIDLDEEPYEPAEEIEVYEPESAPVHEEDEESDYSPPPAAAGPSEPNRGRQRGRANGGQGGTNGYGRSPPFPYSHTVRRSSSASSSSSSNSLADSRTSASRRQSDGGIAAPIQNPRKRRREYKQEKRRDQRDQRDQREKAAKVVVRSPEPYIKEEPESPPPFSAYPDSPPNKRRALPLLNSDVDPMSPRDGRMQPIHYREAPADHSPRSRIPYEEPNTPAVVRIPQPRRIERDDQDLRRVASLQNARRPYSPPAVEAYHAVEPRQLRAPSHAYMDRGMEPVYRDISVHPGAPRYMRDRSRSPVYEFVSRPQSPMAMAPPPRRMITDQFGNKYYAAAPMEIRESVAPPRRMEAEPYYERVGSQQPAMRAPSRTELYQDDSLMRMPPPPPRRYVEASEAELMEARHYRQREPSHRPVEVEYMPRAGGERRPVIQYEDMGPPREYLPSRAYSVRPEMVRREVGDEYAPVRHESVAPRYVSAAAPRYREVSVVHQEAPDERMYAMATPQHGRRYVEEGAVERPVEVHQMQEQPYGGEARRVSYRY